MLNINLEADINNIAFLEYMKDQEHRKVHVDRKSIWWEDRPRNLEERA
jgi:hypothetical protein